MVDRYAQERFRAEAEATVNRANLYSRVWKYAEKQAEMSPYLLIAEVISLVEFDENIYSAGEFQLKVVIRILVNWIDTFLVRFVLVSSSELNPKNLYSRVWKYA